MKRKLVIATHSTFAEGIKNAMELIAGTQDFVYTLCAYTDEITEVKTPVTKRQCCALGPWLIASASICSNW